MKDDEFIGHIFEGERGYGMSMHHIKKNILVLSRNIISGGGCENRAVFDDPSSIHHPKNKDD